MGQRVRRKRRLHLGVRVFNDCGGASAKPAGHLPERNIDGSGIGKLFFVERDCLVDGRFDRCGILIGGDGLIECRVNR